MSNKLTKDKRQYLGHNIYVEFLGSDIILYFTSIQEVSNEIKLNLDVWQRLVYLKKEQEKLEISDKKLESLAIKDSNFMAVYLSKKM